MYYDLKTKEFIHNLRLERRTVVMIVDIVGDNGEVSQQETECSISWPRDPSDDALAAAGLVRVSRASVKCEPWQAPIWDGEPKKTKSGWVLSGAAADIPVDALLNLKFDELKTHRDAVLNSGIVVDGVKIATDDKAQMRALSALSLINNVTTTEPITIDWKGDGGYIKARPDTMKRIGVEIGLHVQACYSAEKAHRDELMKLKTAREIHEYDFKATGWPDSE